MSIGLEIVSAYEDFGYSVDEIASETGLTNAGVKGALKRHGITALDAEDRFIIGLCKWPFKGTDKQIAEIVECSAMRVNKLRREHA